MDNISIVKNRLCLIYTVFICVVFILIISCRIHVTVKQKLLLVVFCIAAHKYDVGSIKTMAKIRMPQCGIVCTKTECPCILYKDD